MNFFPATVADRGTRLAAEKFSLPVPNSMRAALAEKDGLKVVVGIRPENLLDPGKPARGETARLSVEVDIVEPLGHEVVVHTRIGDDIFVAKLDPHRIPAIGSTIEIVVELDAMLIFDAATEGRLTVQGDGK